MRVIGALPARMPLCMLRLLIESVVELFSVSVPPVTARSPVLVIEVPMVVVAAFFVTPVTL